MKSFKKIVKFSNYFFYLVIFIIVFDVVVFHNLLGYGYPRHFTEEKIQRYPAPYVMFTGKPNVHGHNELGFQGPALKDVDINDFKIAFFAGSTGYHGDPPLPVRLEKELNKLMDIHVSVASYSVVSSNHRQHLHGIIEFLPSYKPDLIVFYGGYNETLGNGYFDPRPGYPYNFFYQLETSPLCKLLLENSAIMGEIDKRTGVFSGVQKLKKKYRPFSDEWNKQIVEKYYETLTRAKNISGQIESRYLGTTKFMAFYQPYQVPGYFLPTHLEIKKNISTLQYVFDVSTAFDAIGPTVYHDRVHVNQNAKEIMGKKIADVIVAELKKSRAIHVVGE